MINKIKEKAKALKINLSALYLASKRKECPLLAKILIFIAIGYSLSPIDLIPDFIPILGHLDDLIIIPFLIYLSLKIIPKELMDECREQAKEMWKNGKPKKWYYAIPIAAIWLLVLYMVWRFGFAKSPK